MRNVMNTISKSEPWNRLNQNKITDSSELNKEMDHEIKYENYSIPNIPPTCYYIPNFVTEAEENLLIHNINKISSVRWTQLRNRRLINLGGLPTSNGMIAEEIPEFLKVYLDRVNELNVFGDVKANHILLNEYKPGQGIMSHFDGPLFYPTITTISIGSHTVLEFNKPRNFNSDSDDLPHCSDPEFKLLIERRSLLILKNDLYHNYMHSISEVESDDPNDPLIKHPNYVPVNSDGKIVPLHRTTRYSLTIRNVPKTSKLKLKFGK